MSGKIEHIHDKTSKKIPFEFLTDFLTEGNLLTDCGLDFPDAAQKLTRQLQLKSRLLKVSSLKIHSSFL